MAIEELATVIESLRTGPAQVRRRLEEIGPERWDWKPADESHWTPRQVAGHLLDAELNLSLRLRFVLAQERPSYSAFDEERWIARKGQAEADLETQLRAWEGLRALNIALLEDAQPQDLLRSGVHSQAGEQTARDIIAMLVRHDQYHLRRLNEWESQYQQEHAPI